MGRITVNAPIRRFSGGRFVSRPDAVAGEEPLQILLGSRPYTVTMRTPGHDLELVAGLLHAEGLITGSADIREARYCTTTGQAGTSNAAGDPPGNSYNVMDIDIDDVDGALIDRSTRTAAATSACGVCGTASIDALRRASRYPLPDEPTFDPEVVLSFQATLRARQQVFARTGGIHAAALGAADGAITLVREDVGRHNAVDKVIGASLLAGSLPVSDRALVTSSRASFEIVQKAVLAGIPVMVAASAPSSLAVDLARAAGLTLIGFAREDSFNVYTAPHRVTGAG